MPKQKLDYKPECCEHCTQTTTYILAVDPGTIAIAKGVARCVGEKKVNQVHIAKEVMKQGFITYNQRSNVARPRAHGLIAKVKGEVGNYVLTKKGARFLKNKIRIPKYAIMDKVTGHQIGYYMPDVYTVGIHDFNDEYWEGINYEIKEGRVIDVDEPDLLPEDADVPVEIENGAGVVEKQKPPEEPKCEHGLPLFVKCPSCPPKSEAGAAPEDVNPQYPH